MATEKHDTCQLIVGSYFSNGGILSEYPQTFLMNNLNEEFDDIRLGQIVDVNIISVQGIVVNIPGMVRVEEIITEKEQVQQFIEEHTRKKAPTIPFVRGIHQGFDLLKFQQRINAEAAFLEELPWQNEEVGEPGD